MTLSLIFLMSLVAVAATLVTLLRIIGPRRVLQHATLIDIGFTVLVCFVLAGSITGLLIGILAGLIMTGTLTLARAVQKQGHRATVAVHTFTAKPEEEDWCPGGSPSRL